MYELNYRIFSKQWFKKPSDGYEFHELPKYFKDWYVTRYCNIYRYTHKEGIKSITEYFWFDYNEQKVFVSRQHLWTGDYIE